MTEKNTKFCLRDVVESIIGRYAKPAKGDDPSKTPLFEYKVTFDECYMPRFDIYYFDERINRLFLTANLVGVSDETERKITSTELEREGTYRVNLEDSTRVLSDIRVNCESRIISKEDTKWEDNLINLSREMKHNLIKISKPEYFDLAVDMHRDLYAAQLKVLLNDLMVCIRNS